MCNCYSSDLEKRMGEDFFFWSFLKESEKTYLRYLKINPDDPQSIPKLEDVCL
jgi:hypothetical protein